MFKNIKLKRESKKKSKKSETDPNLQLIANTLKENPEEVKKIQEENEEASTKIKSKKERKKKSKKPAADPNLQELTDTLIENPEKVTSKIKSGIVRNRKLIKLAIPILLVIMIVAGAAFFILKSGMFSGSGEASGNHEDPAEKEKEYAKAQDYYSAGKFYDASALFTLLEDYENSKEMLGKIDLNSHYPGNGAKIAEYIGSDVVNGYISSYQNYKDITTELGTMEKTTEKATEEKTEKTTEKSAEETDKTAEETEKTTEATEKSEEKIEYDESVKETVKEKTHELIKAGNQVKSLNLSSDNILYAANEILKKSADYNIQAAEKIQEGVEAGTYSPNGTNEISKEVQTLIDEMKNENNHFVTEVEKIINDHGIEFVSYSKTGEYMKRFSESIDIFYRK